MENQTSSNLSIEQRHQNMLVKLDARRHSQQQSLSTTNGLESKKAAVAVDELQKQAVMLLADRNARIEPEFLDQLKSTLSVIPSGRQSRLLTEALNKLRIQMRNQAGITENEVDFSFTSSACSGALGRSNLMQSEDNSYGALGGDALPKKLPSRSTNLMTIFLESGKTMFFEDDGRCGEEVSISDVENCHITIAFNSSAVHIRRAKSSTVLFAPVATSLLIRDCANVKIVAAAQQIRLHNSHDVKLYAAVRGAVIIEDCDGIQVAPYRMENVELANFNVDSWCNVKDFNWLAHGVQSPNWQIMAESEWKTFNLQSGAD